MTPPASARNAAADSFRPLFRGGSHRKPLRLLYFLLLGLFCHAVFFYLFKARHSARHRSDTLSRPVVLLSPEAGLPIEEPGMIQAEWELAAGPTLSQKLPEPPAPGTSPARYRMQYEKLTATRDQLSLPSLFSERTPVTPELPTAPAPETKIPATRFEWVFSPQGFGPARPIAATVVAPETMAPAEGVVYQITLDVDGGVAMALPLWQIEDSLNKDLRTNLESILAAHSRERRGPQIKSGQARLSRVRDAPR